MSRHVESYSIRWNDLDTNRHLANTSYMSLFTETRVRYLAGKGVTQELFETSQIGPVIFNEDIHYFREIKGGEKIHIDLECSGVSENGTFFEFKQHLYNSKGEICAYLDILAAWFSLESRKLIKPTELIRKAILDVPRTENFRYLKKEDIRRVPKEMLSRTLPLEARDS